MKKLPLDICRCHDDNCPEKEDCLRYKDKPDEAYWSAAFAWEDGCEFYIECEASNAAN